MSAVNFFATTSFRNENKKFGIKLDDRRRHVYIVGKTGMGKSALLKNMVIQDIRDGHGVCFVDPHGEVTEELLDFIPEERIDDVIYFNPADVSHPIAFNVMENVDPDYRHLVASGLMGVFKKIWPDVWSARMEYILNNAILALLEYPGSTLLGINRLLSDPSYREKVLEKVKDPVIKSFWVNEFGRYSQRYESEATAAIQNKIGQFISAPLIRNIVGQVNTSFNLRAAMDSKKIILLNLSKGRIGEDSSRLLGGLLITKLQLAAMSRVDTPEERRNDFFLYVDEFQNFATESFVNILSEARKYRLALILAHQYISQMEEGVRDAVFGNMGSLISFRVGAEDAEYLEKEFSPDITADDLVNLPKYSIYLKLMVNGLAGRPFSASTLPPFDKPSTSFAQRIIELSQEKYSTPRNIVEEQIAEWSGDYVIKEADKKKAPVLYDAQCQMCGKEIKVPFQPDGLRPVYCKACLKKVSEGSKDNNEPDQDSQDKPKTVSLEDLLPKEIKKKRKPVSRTSLREALDDVLRGKTKKDDAEKGNKQEGKEEIEEESAGDKKKEGDAKKEKKGIIEPGDIIKF